MELFPHSKINDGSLKTELLEERLMVEAQGIEKSFGSKKILENLDFSLPEGKIYAICGNNGAGKSVFAHHYRLDLPRQRHDPRKWTSSWKRSGISAICGQSD